MQITILTEQDCRTLVSLDRGLLDVVRRSFSALASGNVVMPPILRFEILEKNAEIDAKSAYIRGLDRFAMKLSPGFFDNPHSGLPSISGLMVLFSSETGFVEGLLLENGYLTNLRTAAAGAVAADHLARQQVEHVGVFGAGVQARLQVQALQLVRQFTRVSVWARDIQKARAYAAEMQELLGVAVNVGADRETVARNADVLITTTPSRSPIVEAAWLQPGLHITAMGSDGETKVELSPEVISRADLFVCDDRKQSETLGELRCAIEQGMALDEIAIVELGELTGGTRAGRDSNDSITVCDLSGTGVQDTAIANLAFDRAKDLGVGQRLKT